MKIIRTVLGDIPADQIGATDAHDHLIRSGGPEIKLDPAFLMDDVETAKKEFGRFLDAGGRTMVCMDPIGCGRNVSKMLEVAKAYEGKGNIVMTTGFQKGGNYCPNTSFLATVDTNIVAKYMIAEVAEGMDLNSYNGPYGENDCESGRYQSRYKLPHYYEAGAESSCGCCYYTKRNRMPNFHAYRLRNYGIGDPG